MQSDRRFVFRAAAPVALATCAPISAASQTPATALKRVASINNGAGMQIDARLSGVANSSLMSFHVLGWFVVTNGAIGNEDLLLRLNGFDKDYSGSFSSGSGSAIALTDGAGWGRCANNGQRNSASLDGRITVSTVPGTEPASSIRAHISTVGIVHDQKTDTSSRFVGNSTHLLASTFDGTVQRPTLTSISVAFRGGLLAGSLRVYQLG